MVVVVVDVAADSTHERGDGDREQDEARAAQRRHDDDPQQASVGQVAEPDRLDARRRRTAVGRRRGATFRRRRELSLVE